MWVAHQRYPQVADFGKSVSSYGNPHSGMKVGHLHMRKESAHDSEQDADILFCSVWRMPRLNTDFPILQRPQERGLGGMNALYVRRQVVFPYYLSKASVLP